MPRSTLIRIAGAILALTAVISVVMTQINWDGSQGSTAAPKIDDLLNVMIVLSSFVFAIVLVMLGYCVWKYRAKPGDESDGEPIHGNTTLEIAWTTIPTVIVLFGAVYSWLTLNDLEARSADRLNVDVTAQQYEWSFKYPDSKVKSLELHVPVNRQIDFRLHALDVIHSFWVPEWRIKKDAVPGITTQAIVTPTTEGNYTLICTELCGFGHSTMRAKVVVQSATAFQKWLASQVKGSGGGGSSAASGGSA